MNSQKKAERLSQGFRKEKSKLLIEIHSDDLQEDGLDSSTESQIF